MIIGVVRESWPGERRVALAPASVTPLVKAGHQVLVESNAGTSAGFTDAAYTEKGATIVPSRADVSARAEMLLRVRLGPAGAPSTDADLAALRPGQSRHCLPRSVDGSRAGPPARRTAGVVVLDGADAAHHAGAEHGRAVVDGHDRRLQGRAHRGRDGAAHVSHADDGGGQRERCARVRDWRRRGRPAGHRHGQAPGGAGAGLRRAAGGEGADPQSRRQGSPMCRSRPPTRRMPAATPRRRTNPSTSGSATRCRRWWRAATSSSRRPRSPAASRRS